MDFNLSSSKITGTPGENGWVQVHEYRPSDADQMKRRGVLFAVVSTGKESEGVEGVSLGREIIGRLHEEYYGKLDTSVFDAIKGSVDKLKDEFSDVPGGIEIAALSVVEGVVYSAAVGGAKVFIYRSGMLAEILSSRESVISASGYPQKGDIMFCVTNNFLRLVSEGVLKASISNRNIENVVEQLAPSIHAHEDSSRVGVVFVKFASMVEQEEELPIEMIENEDDEQKLVLSEMQGPEGAKPEEKNSFAKLKQFRFFRPDPSKKLFIRQQTRSLEETQSKKTAISVGLIILVLLLVSIGFGIKQKKQKDQQSQYESVLAEAQHKFDEANEIFSLNPERARELFTQSKDSVQQLLTDDVKDERVDSLWSNLQQSEGVILGEYNVDPELFVDLTLQSNDLMGTDMAISDDTAFVLDKDAQKAVSVVLDTKNTRLLAGPSLLGGAKHIASYSDRAFILTDNSVFEVGDEKRDLIEKDWEGDVLPYAYTGNFYLLDKGASQIYRYAAAGAYFSPKTDWLNDSVEVDLSNAISWAIDGNIWVLNDGGDIMRFSLGNLLAFSPKGVSPEFETPKQIYTGDETNYLYVLDPDNSRVVVLDKEGEFKAQYVSDKIKDAVDFGVSENLKKMIILTPGKLLSVELKHI